MRILVDSNVVLDVLLQRDPWHKEAALLWQAVDDGRLKAYMPASAVTDIFYVSRRLSDLVRARQAVQICLDAFNIGTVDRFVLERAQALGGSDFEDNVQIACAEAIDLDAIVTRNSRDFQGSMISVLSPKECLKILS
ncbi:MAG: PIN domain-containing protein [Pyrinomonadaceae bacterium]